MKHSKLKRRLRKKLRTAEFQELGFEISVEFKSILSEADFDKFIEEIEENKLLFGGGGNDEVWAGFITSSKNYQSPTNEQRKKIKNWLESRSEIAKCEVGNFIDAWYDVK